MKRNLTNGKTNLWHQVTAITNDFKNMLTLFLIKNTETYKGF